jgi:hypothetical protein
MSLKTKVYNFFSADRIVAKAFTDKITELVDTLALVVRAWPNGAAVTVGQIYRVAATGRVYQVKTAGTTHANTPPTAETGDIENGTNVVVNYLGTVPGGTITDYLTFT